MDGRHFSTPSLRILSNCLSVLLKSWLLYILAAYYDFGLLHHLLRSRPFCVAQGFQLRRAPDVLMRDSILLKTTKER